MSEAKNAVDQPRIEAAVREILLAIGEDPDRDGLQQTPARVARAVAEGVGGNVEDAHHEGAFGGERVAGQGCYTGGVCGFGHGFNRTESAG